VTAHLILIVYHKHAQWRGPGRTRQRRGPPANAGLRGQGRRAVVHRLRCPRAHERGLHHQSGVEVRPL
jgi:hypothetical protein